MITFDQCLSTMPLEHAALDVINKLVFHPRKAYTTSSDGKTYFEFGSRLMGRFHKLKKTLLKRDYRFKPSKLVRKRTKLSKIRDIYLSCWDDKIVETWLNDTLNRLLSEWFSKHAYAYRIDDLGLDSCQDKIIKISQFAKFFVKRDIKQYFYSIDHEILLRQLAEVLQKDDFIYELVRQRVQFKYVDLDGTIKPATIGIPFGSPLACTLSNIHLTALDKEMTQFKVHYFRYADDVLIAGTDPDEVLRAAAFFDKSVVDLKLALKESHALQLSFIEHPGFTKVSRFTHLGLELMADGRVKFGLGKQRKIMNFFRKELNIHKRKLRATPSLDERLRIAVLAVNSMIDNRIRSAAIVDYYLKHVTFEEQLKNIDRLVAEMVISHVLDKPFRKSDFRTVPFKKLREMGLQSLLHRSRLHHHGHLHVSFLSMHNELVARRHQEQHQRRRERIDQMRLSRKIKRSVPSDVS
jgi:retron-type reverse transcriptase